MFQNHNNLHLLQSKCLKSNTTSEQAAPKSQHVTVNKRMAATSDNTNEHTILHTNDIHGRFVEDDGRVIGMAKVKVLKTNIIRI